jgi:large subunit ribosomal protein L4
MEKAVFSVKGEEIRNINLSDDVFASEVKEGAIYYAITNELANTRVGTACTKTRAEVQGTSAKPWAQKGTGRARSGRRRSPLWVGGGIIFGPRPRDYGYAMPRKMKRAAMVSLLSLKAGADAIKVVEDFTIPSGKTRDLAAILAKLVNGERTVIVMKDDDKMLKRAGANIPWVSFLAYNRLRAHDLFYGKNILVLESAVNIFNILNKFYGPENKEE